MTKVKTSLEKPKDDFRHPKGGSIHKKKNKKFKNTPTGKVALINGSQDKSNGKQASRKKGKDSHKSPKSKTPPTAKNGTGPKKSPASKTESDEEEEVDSDEEDINEGISITEVVSGHEDELEEDDSSEDDAAPDIFGASLAEETDDSDEEFDAEDDGAAAKVAKNKGVAMFKGVKKLKEPEKSDEDDEATDEDDEDDDEDDEDDEEEAAPGLAALLGDSIADESDDEEFTSAGKTDSDSDDEIDEEDESDDGAIDQSLNSSNAATTDTDEDDEEEDDDDDDDDDDEDDDTSPKLKDLLGHSLADDSDDDDFEGDEDEEVEDEDISDEEAEDEDELAGSPKTSDNRSKHDIPREMNESHDSMGLTPEELNKMSKEEREERDKRTIYIGNVPKDTTVNRLTKEFKKFGAIDSVRIRGIVPANPKMPLKAAAITKQFHPKSTTVYAFVSYKSEDSVAKALAMNGKKLDGNYLRVDATFNPKAKIANDIKKSVFLGNLPFTVEDNVIWEAFKDCGKIESVRIVRDRKTGIGRGFGYVNFENADGAVLALNLNGTKIEDRELRVKVNVPEGIKKPRTNERSKKRQLSEGNENDSPKKMKINDEKSIKQATHNSVSAEKRVKSKRSQGEKQRQHSSSKSPQGNKNQEKFQGQTAGGQKKRKQDKSAKKKQHMAAKLLSKPKKSSA